MNHKRKHPLWGGSRTCSCCGAGGIGTGIRSGNGNLVISNRPDRWMVLEGNGRNVVKGYRITLHSICLHRIAEQIHVDRNIRCIQIFHFIRRPDYADRQLLRQHPQILGTWRIDQPDF